MNKKPSGFKSPFNRQFPIFIVLKISQLGHKDPFLRLKTTIKGFSKAPKQVEKRSKKGRKKVIKWCKKGQKSLKEIKSCVIWYVFSFFKFCYNFSTKVFTIKRFLELSMGCVSKLASICASDYSVNSLKVHLSSSGIWSHFIDIISGRKREMI